LIGACVVLAAGAAVAAVESSGGGSNQASFRTIASGRCLPLRYGGEGSPQLLIAADLPLQPGILETTSAMEYAMTLELQRHRYKAGRYPVGLQVCDDATQRSPSGDDRACSANAGDYVKDPSVIGIAGPLTSGCAADEIPILNRAPNGPLAIVGPSATFVGLTRKPARGSTLPAVFYPTHRRNFARVIPADDAQAAADAIAAGRLGVKRVYAVDQGDDPSSSFFAASFARAARRLGVAVAGSGTWVPEASSDGSLVSAIARTHVDGVFLAVSSNPESVRLLTALRRGLGRGVQLMAPDGFDPATAVLAGPAAEGMTISQPGPVNDRLGKEGKRFVAAFSKRFGGQPTRYAVEAAQAIDVLLGAIASSDGTRSSVTSNLFKTQISNGILGSFGITPTGDTTLNAVAIYRIIGGKVTTFTNVVVPDALLAQR
jgi:branched-chain amino acid transport system substrate-binding protein